MFEKVLSIPQVLSMLGLEYTKVVDMLKVTQGSV